MDAGLLRPVASDPASSSNSRRKVELLPYKFCAESSSDSPENNTPTTTPALSSLAPSSSSPSPPQSPDSVSPQNLSPSSSSAFVSASASPFLVSPSFNAEPEDRLPPISEHIHGKYGTLPNMGPLTSLNPRPFFSSLCSNAHLLPSSSSIPTLGRPQLCDVFIGYSGNDHLLLHFCKWLQAELELQGIACFAANRGNYSEPKAHDVARKIMNSARCGVVVITKCTFRSPWAMEELRVFLGRRSLLPILFDISLRDCCPNDIVMQRHAWEREGGELWRIYGGSEVEWRDIVDALLKVDELNACNGNWRDCILKSVGLLGSRLGRKSVAEKGKPNKMTIEDVELPLPRNTNFVGRERELETIYNLLFYGKERRNEVPAETIVNDWPHTRDDLVPKYEMQVQFTAHKNRTSLKTRHNRERKMHRQKMRPVVKEDITREREFEWPCTTQSWVYVHGMPGMGKTELALEYAYRNIQHYKMVLWVQGEARYLRQNYLTLSSLLDVNVAMSVPSGSERSLRTFREMEIEAVERVRRELSRNIPYLLVIDNLEIDRDWWDGLDLVDLLPEAGSATHVIVTTRLKSLPRLQQLQLSCLEGAEIISLMKGNKVFSEQELSALGKIAEKLGNLTFALFIVSKLLELSILPSRLLQTIEKGPRDQFWTDTIYGSHPFVLAVVEHCFILLDKPHKVNRLAINMAWSTGWLAPGPIPLNLLACIAAKCGRKSAGLKLVEWCQGCCYAPKYKKEDIQAGLLLVKYGLARASSQNGCIQVHDIIQIYARRKGGVSVARLVAFGICKFGFLSQHSLHWWAAAFLVFGFGNENATVKMKVSDLLPFSKRVVLPLALHAFTLFCRCHAALELIRLCGNVLDEVLQSFDLQNLTGWDKMFCCKLGRHRGANEDVDEYLWQDVTLFKALLLETSAKLLMEGGQFDTGEEMCRTCISIRTVMLGKEHSDTISAQGMLNKLARLRANC